MERTKGEVLRSEALKVIPTELIIEMAERTEQSGRFAILLTSGKTLAAQRLKSLNKASNGDIWIDIMLSPPPKTIGAMKKGIITAQTSTPTAASINTSNIEAIFELAD